MRTLLASTFALGLAAAALSIASAGPGDLLQIPGPSIGVPAIPGLPDDAHVPGNTTSYTTEPIAPGVNETVELPGLPIPAACDAVPDQDLCKVGAGPEELETPPQSIPIPGETCVVQALGLCANPQQTLGAEYINVSSIKKENPLHNIADLCEVFPEGGPCADPKDQKPTVVHVEKSVHVFDSATATATVHDTDAAWEADEIFVIPGPITVAPGVTVCNPQCEIPDPAAHLSGGAAADLSSELGQQGVDIERDLDLQPSEFYAP